MRLGVRPMREEEGEGGGAREEVVVDDPGRFTVIFPATERF